MKPILTASLAAALIAGGAAVRADTEHHDGRKLAATLSGANEVPPADPDGRGSFEARVNPGTEQICYTLQASWIMTATAAHIHSAPAGVNGGVVLPLLAPSDGNSEECKHIDRALALDLIRDPGQYYVNVHNAEFPGGAVRGQLTK